jgi:tetratricopeptide (TPR) repeat protein
MIHLRDKHAAAMRLAREGDSVGAVAELRAGLEIALKEQEPAWVSRFALSSAVISEHRRDFAGAVEILEKALAFNKNDRHVLFHLGSALQQLGKRDRASDCFGRCALLSAGDPEMLELLRLRAAPPKQDTPQA